MAATEARQTENEGDWEFFTADGTPIALAEADWSNDGMFEELDRAVDDSVLQPITTMEEWDAFEEEDPDFEPDPDDFETCAGYATAFCKGKLEQLRLEEAQASGRFIELEDNDEVGFLRLKEDDDDVCITDAIEEECDNDARNLEEAHPVLQFMTWLKEKEGLELAFSACVGFEAPEFTPLELLVKFKGYDVRRFRLEQERIKAWEAECADDSDE